MHRALGWRDSIIITKGYGGNRHDMHRASMVKTPENLYFHSEIRIYLFIYFISGVAQRRGGLTGAKYVGEIAAITPWHVYG